MIATANKKSIRNLSMNSLKANKMRNFFAVIAIALTTVLFTSIVTIGMSLIKSLEQGTMRQVGGKAHGSFKYLTKDELNKIKDHKLIKEFGYSIMVGIPENKELGKRPTEMRYSTDKNAELTFNLPTTGRMPQNENEIAMDTIVLDKLGIPHELGKEVKLSYNINGKKCTDTFILSGYWKGDGVSLASMIWVSEDFIKVRLADIDYKSVRKNLQEKGLMSGLYFGEVMFSNSFNIEGKMLKILSDNGYSKNDIPMGINWAYASEQLITEIKPILGLVGLILLIMFSGYLIIFNIFYISVAKDTRFYGMLKTVGTTTKQIKKLVRNQAMILSAVGIPIGLGIGYIVGSVLVPFAMQSLQVSDIIISFSPIIFIASALFSIITVSISCRKPAKLASKISPIEAIRYTDVSFNSNKKYKKSTNGAKVHKMALANIFRNKKKAVVVMISLSISIVLLNSVYSIVKGFDMEKFLKGKMESDFVLGDTNYFNPTKGYRGEDTVSEELINEIHNLKGVEKIGRVYFKEGKHKVADKSLNWVKEVLEDESALKNNEKRMIEEAKETLKNGEINIHLNGIDEFMWDKFEKFNVGNFDAKEFATGNYVIISHAQFDVGKNKQQSYYDIGETIKIVYDNNIEKSYKVMAIAMFPTNFTVRHFHPDGIEVFLPADEFKAHVKNATIMTAAFDVEDKYNNSIENYLENYIKTKNSELQYQSRKFFEKEFEKLQSTYNTVGYSLSFVIALIGIFNFVNSMATSIASRKREYAMFQSIGMTGIQLYKMLIFEGLYYAFFTILIVLTLGTGLNYFIVNAVGESKWFFTYHFTLTPVIICIPFLIIISVLIPIICYKTISKMSIVERLREVE